MSVSFREVDEGLEGIPGVSGGFGGGLAVGGDEAEEGVEESGEGEGEGEGGDGRGKGESERDGGRGADEEEKFFQSSFTLFEGNSGGGDELTGRLEADEEGGEGGTEGGGGGRRRGRGGRSDERQSPRHG